MVEKQRPKDSWSRQYFKKIALESRCNYQDKSACEFSLKFNAIVKLYVQFQDEIN